MYLDTENNFFSHDHPTDNQMKVPYNFNLTKVKKYSPYKIKEIGLCVSNCCNFRCNYCIDSVDNSSPAFLSVKQVNIFLDEIFKIWKIRSVAIEPHPLKVYFSGAGEQTFLWDRFKEIVLFILEKSKKHNIPIQFGITTNGYLKQDEIEFLSNNFDYITVSYDGTPQIQNTNRKTSTGNPTSNIVAKTINSLLLSRAKIIIRTTIWPQNFKNIESIISYLYLTFGSNFIWELNPVIPIGRAEQSLTSYTGSYDFAETYSKALMLCKKYGITTNNVFFPTSLNQLSCGAYVKYCQCPWLLPSGEIVSCIESMKYSDKLGYLNDCSVIWNDHINPVLEDSTSNANADCVSCFAYPFCKCGCPARRLEEKNKNSIYWKCEQIKNYVSRIYDDLLAGKQNDFIKLEKVTQGNTCIYKLENII